MPHPRILKALGMSPAQWGELPPETAGPDRNDLKKKALEIIRAEDAKTIGLNDRVSSLETRVTSLESRPVDPPSPVQ